MVEEWGRGCNVGNWMCICANEWCFRDLPWTSDLNSNGDDGDAWLVVLLVIVVRTEADCVPNERVAGAAVCEPRAVQALSACRFFQLCDRPHPTDLLFKCKLEPWAPPINIFNITHHLDMLLNKDGTPWTRRGRLSCQQWGFYWLLTATRRI